VVRLGMKLNSVPNLNYGRCVAMSTLGSVR
jgi:hypothetical protein